MHQQHRQLSNADVLFEGEPTGIAHLHDVARLIREHAPYMTAFRERPALIVRSWHLPLLLQANDSALQGFIRPHNPTSDMAEIQIYGDDTGDPAEDFVTVTIDPSVTVMLSAQDLEAGNAELFEGRFGDGAGKWRVRVETADQRALLVRGPVATRDGAVHNVSR